ncbi:hypothetical protein M0R45_009341 [Rubus argutus]|uniref:Uncharacterized protein n=1 Tax=Rubus argutus TaxID=59490 RepID=A0AAW1Y4M0_RUBAR
MAAHVGGKIMLKGLYSGLTGNLAGVLPGFCHIVGVYEPTKQKLLKSLPENLSALAQLLCTSQANNPSPAVRPPSPDTCADTSLPPTPFHSITETTDFSTRRHDPSHGRASVLPLPITSVDHTQSTANHHLDFEIHPSRTAGFPIPCSAVALGSLSSPSSTPSHGVSASTYLVLSPLTNKY